MILDKICYISRNPEEITDLYKKKLTVKPTFAYNPDSKTSPHTAERWAKGYSRYGESEDKLKAEPETFENTPFSARILSLDIRSEGGRAYKVVDEQNRLFDLREDQLLEALKLCGIGIGGFISEKFVWGTTGSQIKMILVGGDTYKELLEFTKKKNEAKQAKKDGLIFTQGKLKVGHIYEKTNGTQYLFIGKAILPGTKKLSFGFVKLPERPDRETLDNYCTCDPPAWWRQQSARVKQTNDLHDRWQTMTWQERLMAIEIDRLMLIQSEVSVDEYNVSYNYYDVNLNAKFRTLQIEFYSSPKFDKHVGEDIEFATLVRKNESNQFRYSTSQRWDLAEKALLIKGEFTRDWSGTNNDRDYHSYREMSDEYKKSRFELIKQRYKFVFDAYMETRKKYKNLIVWK